MSKIIDITDKLNFEEKPIIKVKDVEIKANNDAVTMLKVIALFDNDGKGVSVKNVLDIYNLLFDEENQQKIDSLKLSFEDFSTLVVNAAQAVINDNEETKGEMTTPATT
ncbi:hypothetical protein MR988_04360 [bacterium]|nr:hypothetical protein [bacterium]